MKEYIPKPIDVSDVEIPTELEPLSEAIAENIHEVWSAGRMKEGCCNTISYPSLSPQENTIILNLARLEHLRWNASHEMLGYSPYSKNEQNPHYCDERTRKHNCLLPWQDLDKESQETTKAKGWEADYQAFDYCVVDTTLLSYKNNLLSLQSTKNDKP